MRFLGHFGDDLRVKRHAAFVPANFCQQPVIESFSSTKPATGKIKAYARHENEVQLV
jgi:hypothetical protein